MKLKGSSSTAEMALSGVLRRERRRRVWVRVWWLATAMIGFAHAANRMPMTLAAWTPATSIAQRHFVLDPEAVTSWYPASEPVIFSPDKRLFFVTVFHGELSSDSNIYELQVFSVPKARAILDGGKSNLRASARLWTSQHAARFANSGAIEDARWEPDSEAILYRGASAEGVYQAFRLDVRTGELTQLTHEPLGIQNFDYLGGGLIYTPIVPALRRSNVSYPMEAVNRSASGEIFPPWRPKLQDVRINLMSYHGSAPRELTGSTLLRIWMAPTGGRALAMQTSRNTGAQFALINLTGNAEPLTTVLSARGKVSVDTHFPIQLIPYDVLWSRDGQRAILVNTRLPDGVRPIADPVDSAYVAEYELARGVWHMVTPFVSGQAGQGAERDAQLITSVAWIKDGESLLVRRGAGKGGDRATLYTRTVAGWKGKPTRTVISKRSLPDGISIELRQSANDEPTLVASNGKHEIALTSPDPALREVWRAPTQSFHWRVGDRTFQGGLMLPRGYDSKERLPLVVQTYRFRPQMFLPDGPHSSVDAAQSLVARGMAVAQIGTIDDLTQRVPSAEEAPSVIAEIDAAVAELVRQGIADPERLGLTGFSRAGYHALYALTNPGTTRFAAVVCADSFTGSYVHYLRGQSRFSSDFVPLYGGPFWTHKSEWLAHEPTFNVDRVMAPLLYMEYGGVEDVDDRSLYSESSQELIGAFSLNRKPIEWLYFPRASHLAQRPAQRLAIGESVVDWLAFWLQDFEDPSEAKAERYARWRPMRELARAAREANSRSPQPAAPVEPRRLDAE